MRHLSMKWIVDICNPLGKFKRVKSVFVTYRITC